MSIRILKPNPTISPAASMGPARADIPPPELARAAFYSGMTPDSPRDDSRNTPVDAGAGHPIYNPGACFTALQKAPVDEVDPSNPQAHGGSPVPFVTAADLLEVGAIALIGAGVLALMAILYL